MANNDSTKRVPLVLLCMLILKEGDRYGYEMVQEIESRSGGLLSFNLASVYVALRRLEERGCVSSRTEMTDAARARMRVYYHLEPAAEAYLTEQKEEYRRTAVGEKKRETARVQSLLCEIPHAETMSYDILCAVAGTPESFAAGFQSRRTQSPLALSAVMLTVLALAFILGAAMGQAREKTQTGGVVMSYRYEDGSLQKLLEERPELLG